MLLLYQASVLHLQIVGIYLGTTYSGLAWAETQRPDHRAPITVWPLTSTLREGEFSDKVPSKLRYVQNDKQWGFSIPSDAPPREVIEWFKLYVPSSSSTSYRSIAHFPPPPLGSSISRVLLL